MHEMMYAGGGSPRPEYPNSGPGPKLLLLGDEARGYFGEVSAQEMQVAGGLSGLLGSIATASGYELSDNVTWIKYFYKGKVVYVPTSLCGRISYKDLENANATYGVTRTVKPTLLPVNGKAMYTENALISGGENTTMRVRLMDASNTSTVVSRIVPYTQVVGTEIGDLWLSRMPGTTPVNPFGLPRRDMNVKAVFTVRPTPAEADTVNAIPGFEVLNPGGYTAAVSVDPSVAVAWRPILELVPRAEQSSLLTPLSGLFSTSSATQTRPLVAVKQIEEPKTLINLTVMTPVVVFGVTISNSGLFAPVISSSVGEPPSDYTKLSDMRSLPPPPLVATGADPSDFFKIN